MSFWLFNRFSRKPTAAFCLTILATMLVTAFLTTRAVRTFLIKNLTESLATQARLISDQLDPAALDNKNLKKLYKRVNDWAGVVGGRITLITPDGVVIADSSVPPEGLRKLENHKTRPEVQQALANASGQAIRHSHTINK